jgi:hypothetical protein
VAARSYEVVVSSRQGRERVHRYASDDMLEPGDVIRLGGRDWLLERFDEQGRLHAEPARYRLTLDHGDGRRESGVLRRWRPDAPQVGHSFTTLDGGRPVAWQVVSSELASEGDGGSYIEFLARRDFGEADMDLGPHELEHAAARLDDTGEVARTLDRAEREGLSVELVALDAGDEPDWEAAGRLIDSLVVEELEDDLIELAGVDTDADPREGWIDTVKARLRADLERFRAAVESGNDQIEEWKFRDGRIFASVGRESEEAEPNSGHGWMVRLVDAEALGAAGFKRVRKAELDT